MDSSAERDNWPAKIGISIIYIAIWNIVAEKISQFPALC